MSGRPSSATRGRCGPPWRAGAPLAQQDDAARALVSEQTEALLRELQRLVEELEG